MGTNSLKLFAALLLTAASMESAHAIPAIDPNVDTPTKAHELVSRAAPSETFLTNTAVATSAEAYTNCCQWDEIEDGGLRFTLNLAGWGNRNHQKNHTISDDKNCALELFNEISSFTDEVKEIDEWMCVPSYGALRDTFVTFNLNISTPSPVLWALNRVVPRPEEWICRMPKKSEEHTWFCKPQQLNI
ncbi:hypothetical protein BGAL_0398g00110 [Botrytis galanthina]|uniref:Ecp2 effector protein domain-containing protein n=1 Tax=Botrytis galanthina TaxID=278940 RepID=A0A4S8QMV2_9HELO|nr:hypothetical protein BGAL_0398g00110 [Botrytis galanthina]